MSMTQEQQRIFEQAVIRGIVASDRHAYEAGCAALRVKLHELIEEEKAKKQAADKAEAEALARDQFSLFPQGQARQG